MVLFDRTFLDEPFPVLSVMLSRMLRDPSPLTL
jgi:hypothetical protein